MALVGGRYELLRPLAGGGMGAVHEALDVVVGRRVALKTLHPHLVAEPALCERFRREAFAAAALAHPHIAQASDYGVDPRHGPYLVLELVVGESLADRLARDGALKPERAVIATHQILDALGAAHAVGIVHRDIKPGNLFLTRLAGVTDVVKVLDFGVAKLYESETWQRLTKTGQVIGTPTYMAPEQALGAPIDARADLYSVGVVLYGMLAGRPAFRPGGAEVLVDLLRGNCPPLREVAPHVEPQLAAVVTRAMSVDPRDRFADAAQMTRALTPWLPSSVGALHRASAPVLHAATRPAAVKGDQPRPALSEQADGTHSGRRVHAASNDTTAKRASRSWWVLLVGVALGLVSSIAVWLVMTSAENGDALRQTATEPTADTRATSLPAPPLLSTSSHARLDGQDQLDDETHSRVTGADTPAANGEAPAYPGSATAVDRRTTGDEGRPATAKTSGRISPDEPRVPPVRPTRAPPEREHRRTTMSGEIARCTHIYFGSFDSSPITMEQVRRLIGPRVAVCYGPAAGDVVELSIAASGQIEAATTTGPRAECLRRRLVGTTVGAPGRPLRFRVPMECE
ncbi:MAG: protein kinase [Sandaracinus sp.]|nr:protein kinase [Sandaracinus sp.]MCB9613846.1 protein kinase [Sandaracinus sp.]MCB9635809.1 protein kinase [Sandaracinus sp.]